MLRLAKLGNQPEIFYTIQGEGASIGRPAVFVRLSLCNLRCVWCDTPYTWNWVGTPYPHEDDTKYKKADEIINLEVAEVADIIRGYNCRRVVISGGEPLIQTSNIVKLIAELGDEYTIEVETNGTIMPSHALWQGVSQFNISPKLEGSGNPAALRRKDNALRFFGLLSQSQFKFVITTDEDLAEVQVLIAANDIPADKVWLMPEGRTQEAVTRNSAALIEVCKEYGYNFTTRLHILVYATERGR